MSRLRVIPFIITTFFTDSDTEQFQWHFSIQQSNHNRLRKLRFRVQQGLLQELLLTNTKEKHVDEDKKI